MRENELEIVHSCLTPRQFIEKHKFIPMGGLRHLLFYSKSNGLEKVLLRISPRKILISEEGFFSWMKERAQRGGK